MALKLNAIFLSEFLYDTLASKPVQYSIAVSRQIFVDKHDPKALLEQIRNEN